MKLTLNHQKGISKVVGVLLLLGIVVALSSVLAYMFTDMANVNETVRAGVTTDSDPIEGETTIRWVSEGNAESLQVYVDGEPLSGAELTESGQSVTIQSNSAERIEVRGSDGDGNVTPIKTITRTNSTGSGSATVVNNTANNNTNTNTNNTTPVNNSQPSMGCTVSGTQITTVHLGNSSQQQYNELESTTLDDKYTVYVKDNDRSRETGAVSVSITAYYGDFGDAPNDTLGPATTQVEFSEDGVGCFTIGSYSTNPDLPTWIAFGPLSSDGGEYTNQIRVDSNVDEIYVE